MYKVCHLKEKEKEINEIYGRSLYSPCCTRNVAKQAVPPIIIEIHKIQRRPKTLRLGHKKMYVGSSQAPAKKKLKISSPPSPSDGVEGKERNLL